MLKEYFKIALKNLRTRRLRSWLTIIGVVIGVFLIVSLISLTEGLKTAILDQLKMMGEDLIIIMPGEITNLATTMGGGMELTDKDIKAIEKTKGVKTVVPLNYKAEIVRYQGKKETILISGISFRTGFKVVTEDLGWQLLEGRWPVPGKREAIMGNFLPKDIFPRMRTETSIFISGKELKIVGILKSVGNKQDDSMIILDLDVFRSVTGERTGAKTAFAKIMPGFLIDEVAEDIKISLNETRKRTRGEDLPSFTVLTPEKVIDIVGNIMGMIQVAVFSLASISIIVGGIGIMNTMYTSVHDRIKEIGIMKAVGAKNRTITTIFLFESGILGIIGGIGGVILGIGLAKSVEFYLQIHPIFNLRASASPWLILFGLTFSFLVGCISGFLPARSAAKLKPVDALRYE